MNRTWLPDLAFLLTTIALFGDFGCMSDSATSGDEDNDRAIVLDHDTKADYGVRHLRCTSSGGENDNATWRLTISRGTPGYQVTAERGLKFPHDVRLDGTPDTEHTMVEARSFVAAATGSVGTEQVSLTFAEGSLQVEAIPGQAGNLYTGTATLPGDADLAVSCWGSWFTPAFRYDPQTGECRDADGTLGMNELPTGMVRETKTGECTAMAGVLNEGDVGYPALKGWNLRGATLQAASLSFAMLVDADLRGASFATLGGGYYVIWAQVDRFSRFDDGCERSGDAVHCAR